jgi:hypothetical protein
MKSRRIQNRQPYFKIQSSKEKDFLDFEKVRLEIKFVNSNVKKRNWLFLLTILQSAAVIAGIWVSVYSFVKKNHEDSDNKIKATLDYVNKLYDPIIKRSQDSLDYFDKLVSQTYDKSRDSLFGVIRERFDRVVSPLTSYYNILQSGIEKGYFDKDLSEALLNNETTKYIYILDHLQSGNDSTFSVNSPDYEKFKGLITFYIAVQDTSGDVTRQMFPRYEYDKPFPYKKFTRGYSPPTKP